MLNDLTKNIIVCVYIYGILIFYYSTRNAVKFGNE